MNIEEALSILKTVYKNQDLTNIQEFVFCETWREKTYVEMADESNYDADYIKFVGFQLWQLLSKERGEKVNKNNLPQFCSEKLNRLQN